VAQDEDLQIPGGVAAGDRASSWMKRRRQVGGSRQHQVAFVVGSSVTVPNRVSMRTCSPQATSEFPHPTRHVDLGLLFGQPLGVIPAKALED
jgi:hypothetical protein